MKQLSVLALLTLSSISTSPAALASDNGFTAFAWGDSINNVSQKNNAFKPSAIQLGGQSKMFNGTPKKTEWGFLGEQASSPYSYSFFQGGLFDITFTAKVYRSNDLATVSQAKADYATLKDQIAQRLGRVENVAESFDPKKPFFSCIYDDNCGSYGVSFINADTRTVLFLTGSEDGTGSELILTVKQKK